MFSILFIFTIFVNLYTLKYLKDLKDDEYCENLNSPYLSWYYNYFMWFLFFLIILFIIVIFIINHRNNWIDPSEFSIKQFKKYTKSRKSLMGNIIDCGTILISGLYIKLLYDIGNEKKCKDIDHNMRVNLLYLNGI